MGDAVPCVEKPKNRDKVAATTYCVVCGFSDIYVESNIQEFFAGMLFRYLMYFLMSHFLLAVTNI
jgi:hypothetical protein